MKKYFILTACLLLSLSAKAIENINFKNKLTEIINMKDDSVKAKEYISLIETYELDLTTEEKLKYSYAALRTAKASGWESGKGLIHYYLGWFYFFDDNRKSAIDHFLKAAELSDNPSISVNSYGTIANIYLWDENHEKALYFASKGVELINNPQLDDKTKAEALVYLGDVYRASGNTIKEKEHYGHAFSITHEEHLKDPSYDIIRTIIYINLSNKTLLDNPFAILKYAKKMQNAYEKSSLTDKYKTIAFLIKVSSGYITSTNSGKIKQLQIEAEAKQRKIYISGIIILSLLLIVLIWQNYSRKKAIDELAKANEMKSRFFGILNHDLRRPVAGLISYLQLKTEAPEVILPEEAAAFEQKTMHTAKNLLENMEDLLFWCKDQMQSFAPDFKIVEVSKLFDDTRSFFEYEENVHISFENPSNLKIKTDENYVKTIMRNLTSNAINATLNIKNPQVIWRCYEKNDKIILSVFNNGKKISQAKIDILENKESKKENNIKEGLGLRIIKDLSASVDCDIKIKSDDVEGTEFFLSFNKT